MRATDAGTPPLHSDVKVTVTAGSTGNQKPVFGQDQYSAKGKIRLLYLYYNVFFQESLAQV